MKLVTFNNLIPSYIMKLIQWRDVEDLDVDEAEREQLLEDAEEDEEVDYEDSPEDKNLHSNSSVMPLALWYSLVNLPKKTGMQGHILDSRWDKKRKHLQITFSEELSELIRLEAISLKQSILMVQRINTLAQG